MRYTPAGRAEHNLRGGPRDSLIFGLLVSTILTLLVIPVVYYAYHWRKAGQVA